MKQQEQEMKYLKICKASAGSGKTFTLAVEYIKHLIVNPMAYRHILAVTFTNKATLEMKQRILSQLYGLSRGLDDSKDYMEALKKALDNIGYQSDGDIENDIREKCGRALSEIIHNYHRFRIETIDSFFQSIVRELAHDLDLTANLKVDLDGDQALEEGVKLMIDCVKGSQEDQEIQNRVITYVNSRMEDNRNWNITSEIQTFGKNIFNETFLEHGEELRKKLDEKGFINAVNKKISDLRSQAFERLHKISKDMLDIITSNGFSVDEFTWKGTGIFGFLTQRSTDTTLMNSQGYIVPNSYVKNCLESPKDWNSKDKKVQEFVVREDMITKLKKYLQDFDEIKATVISCDAVKKNLNNLSLINFIDKKVQIVTSNRNDFLLANTNHFLSQMISDSDVPFIYERTGTRFDHIMIDEFQDTSGLQWKNFKPLIQNSLSAHNECMLVGDVKQSIYRWRNSEWSILNNISHDPTFSDEVNDTPLNVNYRSKGRIITFNNEFFTNVTKIMGEEYTLLTAQTSKDIDVAYSECKQEFSKPEIEEEGHVRIELQLLKGKDDTEDVTEDGTESSESDKSILGLKENELWECRHIEQNVKELLSKGVKPNDICILIRANDHAPIICSYFDQFVKDEDGNPIKIVSSQTYELQNSQSVIILIWALRTLVSPDDHLAHSMLTYHYQTGVLGNSEFSDDLNKVFLLKNEELDALLPKEFTNHLANLEVVPLYELCERLYHIFQLERIDGQDSYLFAFFDYLTDYLERHTSDIDSFLTYWDDTLYSKTISDGAQDGIRIMTIHKSKGLEFHSVIVPFCSWKIVESKELMWCTSHKDTIPYNDLPLIPIKNSEKLLTSVFSADSQEEYLKTFVDNMNILYVAFTRASKNLIILSDNTDSASLKIFKELNKKGEASIDAVKGALNDRDKMPKEGTKAIVTPYDLFLKGKPKEMDFQYDEDSDAYVITSGDQFFPSKSEEEETKENVFEKTSDSRHVAFHSNLSRAEFRQSNESQRFVDGEEEETNDINYQSEGLIFHDIMSRIRTLDDVEREIQKLDFEGHLSDGDQRDRIRDMVNQAISSTQGKEWFDPHWTVINEQSILFRDSDGKVVSKRPDRVITDDKETIVIDYKTGAKNEDYKKQVGEYMERLTQMGMPNVKGYLWYIRNGEICQI